MEQGDQQDNPLAGISIGEPQQHNSNSEQQPSAPQGMSKSKMKKLKRKQLWQEAKKTKKIQKKEQKKLNKMNKPKPPPVEGPKQPIVYQKKRKQDYIQKVAKGIKVVIDLQFYKSMTQKQQNSLYKQLSHCHSLNRNAEQAMNLNITSVTPEIFQLLDKKFNGSKWGIGIRQKHFIEEFNHQDIVYLTGDAQQELQQLEKDKVYVIGGIVDHNRLKNITYNYSIQNKLNMKRFPLLGDQIALKGNAHLAVNHVFDIIVKVANGESWQDAITEAIPGRKLKGQDDK